jgi:tRNA(fMet)-specific endonuclease VapC
MIAPCLVDTDTLSEIQKGRNPRIVSNANAYLQVHGNLSISAFTWFEVVRGLRWQNASAKLIDFDQLCQRSTIYPVAGEILNRAADLWAIAASQGKSKMDADLIIAATAIHHGLELVTGNQSHFRWIPLLVTRDWRS